MINVLASETFSAVSAPIQYAAIKAYENDHSNYINKSKNILSAVGNYVYENLKSNKILINKPQGGFYLMPEFLNKKFKSSSEMCDSILNDTGVALLPGSDFGFDETKMLARLSFTDFDGQNFMNQTQTVSGPILTTDGIPLKVSLKKVERKNKIRAFLLVLPLLAFILVTFLVPIADMLTRSIDDRQINTVFPKTFEVYKKLSSIQ